MVARSVMRAVGRIDKQLDGRLEQIMNDLGDEVWNDEKAAQ